MNLEQLNDYLPVVMAFVCQTIAHRIFLILVRFLFEYLFTELPHETFVLGSPVGMPIGHCFDQVVKFPLASASEGTADCLDDGLPSSVAVIK